MKQKYATQILEAKDKVRRRSLSDLIPNAPSEAIDLLEGLFTYDPVKRLTALQVLQHPFLASLYDGPNDKSVVEGKPVKYYDFEFEQFTL